MTASGDVADYTATVQEAIIKSFASVAGVLQSSVSLKVTAASVRLEITIESASKAAAETAQSNMGAALSDASAATDLMPAGFTVESTPIVAVTAAPAPGTSLSPPPSSLLVPSTPLIAGVAAAFVGLNCLLCIAYYKGVQSKRRNSRDKATILFDLQKAKSGSLSSKQDYLADLGAGVMDAVADEEDSVKSPQPLPPPGATIPDPLEA